MIFRLAALIVDAWLGLVRAARTVASLRPVRDAWRAVPGDAIGLLVMLACGIRRPTRTIQSGDVRVAVIEHPRIDRWFRLHLMPVTAQTLGRFVMARGPIPDETMEHELEHVRQWSRLGPLYLPLYFASSGIQVALGRRAYWDNTFELAARERARDEMAARTNAAAAGREGARG